MANLPLLVGHRGASAYKPDNTLESFRQAIAEGADMIELDVRKTADGELVLYHDWYLNSDFGISKPAAIATFDELAAFCLTRGIRLTTLDEVLGELGDKIPFNIELKASGYERETLEVISRHKTADGLILSSFFPWVILKLKSLDSSVKTGWIVGQEQVLFFNRFGGPPVEWLFGLTKAESVHLHYKIITAGLIKRFHSKGVSVQAWTVDDIETANRLIEYGIDAIITNKPGQLRAYLDGRLEQYEKNLFR
ncbi:MAG: glycerophosphodiester phosphodiesterase [candidate division Zixibacteria bacterium]|jgi:glycerophosphoryl diester phosphodiesterase|nr:glycerophosphodiester phosphodiesterase [candidate division Zixibacteria bacterium]